MASKKRPGPRLGGRRSPTAPASRLPGRPSTTGATSTPTAAQQSAYDVMNQTLTEYGLSELSGDVWGLIQGGITDAASIQMHLQDTDAWKRRFAGNAALRQQGLGVLSPAEYIATERSYAQIMRNNGLPAGFYDDPSDFAKFIGANVSADELNQRVTAYSDLAGREDPQLVNQLQSMGLSKGDLLAFMIDPSRAKPLVMRQYQTALLGTKARGAGFTADNAYLSHLAENGVTEQQAQQGYGLIADSLADAQRLGLTADELQSEIFDNNADATKKRKRLASQERGSFAGSSGVAGGSLAQNGQGSY